MYQNIKEEEAKKLDGLMLSVRVVAPLFIWMALGLLLRRALGLDATWLDKANKLVFNLLLPCLLFQSTLSSGLLQNFSQSYFEMAVFALAALVISVLVLGLIVPRFARNGARSGVLVQGMFRANNALYGIPVALAIFGESGAGVAAFIVAVTVPMLNILSIIILERFCGGKSSWGRVLLKIVTNPLIIAIALGFLWQFLALPLPEVVATPIKGLAECTTPLSFLILGAGFSFKSAAQNHKALAATCVVKLVLMPLVWVSIAVMLGFRGEMLCALLVVFAPPTAVSSFPMASAMGGDKKLASEMIVFTSALSVFSMFGWIWVLRSLALL